MLPICNQHRTVTFSLCLALLATASRIITAWRTLPCSVAVDSPARGARIAWANHIPSPQSLTADSKGGNWGLRRGESPTMALSTSKTKARRAQNVEGNLYVDESCIDCDTCRWMQGDVFVSDGGKSAVVQQPVTAEEKLGAYRAMVACPVGSIRLETPDPLVRDALEMFPVPVDAKRLPGVYHMGFHDEKSFSCLPWLVVRQGGNVMMDSPRINGKLAQALQKKGGVKYMVLSHIDDVGDHQRWKERFPEMTRIIHQEDVQAHGDSRNMELQLDSNSADGQFRGLDFWDLGDDLRILHTPGHSRGSITLLYRVGAGFDDSEGVAFTGDTLAFSSRTGALTGFPRYGWNHKVQAKSMELLASPELKFRWMLPGHGRTTYFSDETKRISQIQWAANNMNEGRP